MGCKGDRCSAPGAGWSSRHDKRILDASHGAEVPVFNVCLAAFWSYSGPIPPFCVSISPFWNEDVSSCSVIAHWKSILSSHLAEIDLSFAGKVGLQFLSDAEVVETTGTP
jgi:hypothetical protein